MHEKILEHFTGQATIVQMMDIIPVRPFLKTDHHLKISFEEMAEAIKAFIAKDADAEQRCVQAVTELTAAVAEVMNKTTQCLKGNPSETHREIAEAIAQHLVRYAKAGNDLSL